MYLVLAGVFLSLSASSHTYSPPLFRFNSSLWGPVEVSPGFSLGSLEIKAGGRRKRSRGKEEGGRGVHSRELAAVNHDGCPSPRDCTSEGPPQPSPEMSPRQ